MTVVIKDLDKAEVLLALYNKACFEGSGTESTAIMQLVYTISPCGTREKANEEIALHQPKNNLAFHSVDLGSGSRPIYADLAGEHFDPTLYDKEHGEIGYAATIIDELRTKLAKQAKGNSIAHLITRISTLFPSVKATQHSDGGEAKPSCAI